MGMNVRESVAEIGKPSPLVGVLCEPEGRKNKDTALILLNSGIMHRVGSCRVSVRIARSVTAELGMPSLRFDFSGVGDSPARRTTGVDFDQGAVAEVMEAMDYMEESRGIKRFILYGLCSGARIACSTAEQDERVAALVQVDGFCYPTPRAWLHYYGYRFSSPQVWRSRLEKWFGFGRLQQGSILNSARADFEVPAFAEDPGRTFVAHQLQRIAARNVALHCVFTGRNPQFCYREQFRECFGDVNFGDHLSVEYYPNASHIFTEPMYQQRMVKGIVAWVGELERRRVRAAQVKQKLNNAELAEMLS